MNQLWHSVNSVPSNYDKSSGNWKRASLTADISALSLQSWRADGSWDPCLCMEEGSERLMDCPAQTHVPCSQGVHRRGALCSKSFNLERVAMVRIYKMKAVGRVNAHCYSPSSAALELGALIETNSRLL